MSEPVEKSGRRRQLPWAVPALTFTAGEALLRASWIAGARWGYTACDRADESVDPTGGCGADRVRVLPFWPGWGALALCVLLAGIAVRTLRRGDRAAVAGAWVAAAGLGVASFPLHLLFQLPAAAAGHPSDVRDLVGRLALLAGAALFAGLAASTAPSGSAAVVEPRPLPRWGRIAAYLATVLPWIGWALPHAFWFFGVPLGIPAEMSADVNLDRATLLAITVLPPLAGLLTLGLAQRWGQVFPRWMPAVGGRAVPRLLAVIPAGLVAMALMTYGILSGWVVVRSLLDGSLSWSQLADGWAAAGTVLVFFCWGAALAVTTIAYQRTRLAEGTAPEGAADPRRRTGVDAP